MNVIRLVGVFSLVLANACASGDGRGSPTSSGVTATKSLDTLTPSEIDRLCEFQEASYKAALTSERVYCLRLTEPAYCEEDLEYCIGSGDYEAELNDDWSCDSDAEVYATCDATVAALETCLVDYNRGWSTRLANKTCENLEPSDGEETPPPSCTALFEQCPAFDL